MLVSIKTGLFCLLLFSCLSSPITYLGGTEGKNNESLASLAVTSSYINLYKINNEILLKKTVLGESYMEAAEYGHMFKIEPGETILSLGYSRTDVKYETTKYLYGSSSKSDKSTVSSQILDIPVILKEGYQYNLDYKKISDKEGEIILVGSKNKNASHEQRLLQLKFK